MFTVTAETCINVHVKCPLLHNFNQCFDISVDSNSSLQFLKNHFAFLVLLHVESHGKANGFTGIDVLYVVFVLIFQCLQYCLKVSGHGKSVSHTLLALYDSRIMPESLNTLVNLQILFLDELLDFLVLVQILSCGISKWGRQLKTMDTSALILLYLLIMQCV